MWHGLGLLPSQYSVSKITILYLSLWVCLKVKLSLCFNRAPRHEGVLGEWRYSSTHSTLALNGVVSFTPRPLYPHGKSPCYPMDRSLGGPQSRSERGGEAKNSQAPTGNRTLEPRSSSPQASRYTELSRLLYVCVCVCDRSSRVRFPVGVGNFSLHHRVQNDSGAHLASYPMGTRSSFPGSKATGAWSWPITCI
jgi:hypothetical protein